MSNIVFHFVFPISIHNLRIMIRLPTLVSHRKLSFFLPSGQRGSVGVFRKVCHIANNGIFQVESIGLRLLFNSNSLIELVRLFHELFQLAKGLFDSKSKKSFDSAECLLSIINNTEEEIHTAIISLSKKGIV